MQKKSYIKKMMAEMENMREALQLQINLEAMAKEDSHARAAWHLQVTLK